MSFRKVPKERFSVVLPPAVVKSIRLRALRERKSLSELTTEFICSGLGRDCRKFGIEPSEQELAATT